MWFLYARGIAELEGKEMTDWSWPTRPTDPDEFGEMMVSLDQHLAARGLTPERRELQAARLVSMALGLSGTPLFGGARGEAYSPGDLLARVFDWYREFYGARAQVDFNLGSVVFQLRGTCWRLRIPMVFGTVRAMASRDLKLTGRPPSIDSPPLHNVLTSVEGLTQAYANGLTDPEVVHVVNSYVLGYEAVAALDELKGNELFDQARGDYTHSVNALMEGRTLSKARWETAQCAEKVFKGLLGRSGHQFPTCAKLGHDIPHLGGLIARHFALVIPDAVLQATHCPTKVRYGEIKVGQKEAWTAHRALLDLLAAIRPLALPPNSKRLRA